MKNLDKEIETLNEEISMLIMNHEYFEKYNEADGDPDWINEKLIDFVESDEFNPTSEIFKEEKSIYDFESNGNFFYDLVEGQSITNILGVQCEEDIESDAQDYEDVEAETKRMYDENFAKLESLGDKQEFLNEISSLLDDALTFSDREDNALSM